MTVLNLLTLSILSAPTSTAAAEQRRAVAPDLSLGYIEGQKRCCIRTFDGCECMSRRSGDCSRCYRDGALDFREILGALAAEGEDKPEGPVINPVPKEEDIGCSVEEQKECNANGGIVFIRGSDCSCVYPEPGEDEAEIVGPGRRALAPETQDAYNPTRPKEGTYDPTRLPAAEADGADFEVALGIVEGQRRCCIRKSDGCLCMSNRKGSCARCDEKHEPTFEDPAETEGPERRALLGGFEGDLGIVKEDRHCCIRKVNGCLCMSNRKGSCARCDRRYPIAGLDAAEVEGPL